MGVVREGLLQERQGWVMESRELQADRLQLLGAVKTCGESRGVKRVGGVSKAVLGSQAGSEIQRLAPLPTSQTQDPLFPAV